MHFFHDGQPAADFIVGQPSSFHNPVFLIWLSSPTLSKSQIDLHQLQILVCILDCYTRADVWTCTICFYIEYHIYHGSFMLEFHRIWIYIPFLLYYKLSRLVKIKYHLDSACSWLMHSISFSLYETMNLL